MKPEIRSAMLLLMGAVPVLMGAECAAAPPPCGGEECGYQTANPDGVPACPILMMCPEAAEVGEECTPDPCDGGPVCHGEASCVPDGAGSFQCANVQRSFGRACEVGDTDEPCQTNSVCINVEACGMDLGMWNLDESSSMCWGFQTEGRPCDGSFSGNENLDNSCYPCLPGFICDMNYPTSVGGTCVRKCESDTDCPCDVSCEMDVPSGSSPHCTNCSHTTQNCDQTADCCNPERDTCSAGQLGPDAGDVCCRQEAVACSRDNECCFGLACDSASGKCVSCIELGEEFDEMHPLGCCAGLEAREVDDDGIVGAVCAAPCDESDPLATCEPCAEEGGRSFAIQVDCSGLRPVCDYTDAWIGQNGSAYAGDGVTPPDEFCDGYDNDCDGVTDNNPVDIGGDCEGTVDSCPGETFEGSTACIDGEVACEVGDDDYCAVGFTAAGGYTIRNVPSGCYPTVGDLCTSHDDCSPGRACLWHDSLSTFVCRARNFSYFGADNTYFQECLSRPFCWHPAGSRGTVERTPVAIDPACTADY